MDKVTLDRIQLLHPKLRDEAMQIYLEICDALQGRAICRFTHTLRTFAEQDALFNAKPQVTKARGGQSYHNYGLAIDIALIIDGKSASWDVKTDFDGDGKSDWMEIVAIFKRYGWIWGGDWKFYDAPHFEKTFGYSVMQLKEMHTLSKVIPPTNYVRI